MAKIPLRGGDVFSAVEELAWPAERIRRYQLHQLKLLVRHAGRHVPFYRARFKESGFDPQAPLTPES